MLIFLRYKEFEQGAIDLFMGRAQIWQTIGNVKNVRCLKISCFGLIPTCNFVILKFYVSSDNWINFYFKRKS